MLRTTKDKMPLSLAEEVEGYIQLSVRNRGGGPVETTDLSRSGFTISSENKVLGRAHFFHDNREKPLMLSRANNTFAHYRSDSAGVRDLQEDLINLVLGNGKS